ncbi:hypothetical protein KDN24_06575 [Bacillus sp. Bva_UNVM-123]|uniref:hypothetical protein n=1 Tax=Bacillus sp. Bva_UNVM-123 TaxID=2829798 RepID=UPI00391FC118
MEVNIDGKEITYIGGDILYRDGVKLYICTENGKVNIETNEETLNMLEHAITEARKILKK